MTVDEVQYLVLNVYLVPGSDFGRERCDYWLGRVLFVWPFIFHERRTYVLLGAMIQCLRAVECLEVRVKTSTA